MYEMILERLLNRLPPTEDKRESSFAYNYLSPVAAELALILTGKEIDENLYYADTATGPYLVRRTEEDGIKPNSAGKARKKGVFRDKDGQPIDIPVQSRFSIDDLNFVAAERIVDGEYVMECEVAGTIGNHASGTLLPIDYIDQLATAQLMDVIVPGNDEEDDESLRKRYFEAQKAQAFGGNIADYKEEIRGIPGVGGVKVYPTWRGGGTVRCVLIGADFNSPSAMMVEEIQTAIDPVENSGEGLGVAPIGHKVTIAGTSHVPVNVVTRLTLESSVTLEQVRTDIEQAITEYLLSLRKTWQETDKIIVRISQLEARILNVRGVLDIADTKLNGTGGNIELTTEQIPKQGEITLE
ncbi:baseplate J/gp47 family protein [Brevibacterium sp. JNUCC-42]|nr:baseplate J/gp47 family protein [Brevibacterium sp. JNUCC-42]